MTDQEQELQELRQWPTKDLVDEYTEVFGRPPRCRHRTWLWKRILWKRVEIRCGGLSKVAQARLERLIAEIDLPLDEKAGGVTGKPSPRGAEPVDGTTLVRSYRGREIAATKVAGAWEYEGSTYASLSAVARAVTGSKWNGRLFFGLTDRDGGRS